MGFVDQRASQSGKDGNQTPDIHSSLEYEETDEEGSLHSFSSLLGKTRSFANGVKTPLPSPEPEQRIKQVRRNMLKEQGSAIISIHRDKK